MKKLHIVLGNIVSDEILELGDAIVNPSNPMMRPGGGVSGEIFRKAGVDELENYTSTKYSISYFDPSCENGMKPGDVRITPGFALKKDIIFAQGPKIWDYENYDDAFILLLKTYENILTAASESGYRSILIPSLGTGSYGFKHELIAKGIIGLLEILSIKYDIDIYLVIYEKEIISIYEQYQ